MESKIENSNEQIKNVLVNIFDKKINYFQLSQDTTRQ